MSFLTFFEWIIQEVIIRPANETKVIYKKTGKSISLVLFPKYTPKLDSVNAKKEWLILLIYLMFCTNSNCKPQSLL